MSIDHKYVVYEIGITTAKKWLYFWKIYKFHLVVAPPTMKYLLVIISRSLLSATKSTIMNACGMIALFIFSLETFQARKNLIPGSLRNISNISKIMNYNVFSKIHFSSIVLFFLDEKNTHVELALRL